MALSDRAPHLSPDPYLDRLLGEVDRLVARVTAVPPAARRALADERRSEAVVATLHLDGAEPAQLPDLERARELIARATTDPADPTGATEPTDPTSAAEPAPDADAPGGTRSARSPDGQGTWLDAFGTAHDPPDELLQALEVVGAVAGLAADDLAPRLVGDGALDALRQLHAELTHGLIAPERAGAPRTFAQAVHDASIGRIMYLPSEPDAIPGELDRLGDWLASEAPRHHPVVAAGVLHAELLRIHPFDAANGRLARTAARLVLRAAGHDPDGLAAPEPALAADPMGYHEAMADTVRRRDLTRWTARWAEALCDGLRGSARRLGALDDVTAPDRATAFVADRDAFTLADYLPVVGGDRELAVADLGALLDAGHIGRVLGSHGLRFRVLA